MSPQIRSLAAAATVLLLVALSFGPLPGREWHSTDLRLLERIGAIETATDGIRLLAQPTLTGPSPLATWVIRIGLAGFGPDSARPFVTTNLLLHAANALLLLWLLRRRDRTGPGALAFVLAFAVHPLQVATVAGLAGTGELIATTFMLLALLLDRGGAANARTELGWLACFAGAVAASPIGLLLPVLLALFPSASAPGRDARNAWTARIPLFVASALAAAYLWTHAARPTGELDHLFGATDHLHHLGAALVLSAADLLVPWRLSPMHVVPPDLPAIATAVGLAAGVTALALLARRSIAGALWLATTLALAALRGWQRFEYRSDAWLYPSVAGLAWLVAGLAGRRGVAVAWVIVAAWSAMAHQEARGWRTERVHLDRAVAQRADNWRALTSRAELALASGDPAQAASDATAALLSQPGSPAAVFTLARARATAGDLDAARLLVAHGETHGWNSPDAATGLGFVFLETAMPDAARDLLDRPDAGPDARAGLALACARLGKTARAEALVDAARRQRPSSPEARLALGWLLATSPEPELSDPSLALELVRDLENPGLRYRSLDAEGAALAGLGRFADAYRAAREAVDFAESAGLPATADAIRQRALVYLQSGRWTEARASDPAGDD